MRHERGTNTATSPDLHAASHELKERWLRVAMNVCAADHLVYARTYLKDHPAVDEQLTERREPEQLQLLRDLRGRDAVHSVDPVADPSRP